MLLIQADPGQKHIALVCGPPHYSPDISMAQMKNELESLGFKVSLILGEGNAEKKRENVLPGVEQLAEADLAIFFMRWLQLPDEEWKHVEAYIKSGKPVMGLRTANHGIKYPPNHPRYHWNDDFGRRVLGTPYVVHQKGSTVIKEYKPAKAHPIMRHISYINWVSPGTLYLARMQPGVTPLILGEGKGGVRVLTKDYGVEVASTLEVDAVAWTWENEWGSKVFYTSLGHLGDFASPSFNRLWINASHWLLDLEVPTADYQAPSWKLEGGKKH